MTPVSSTGRIPVAVSLPDQTPAPAVIVLHGQGACKERWYGELASFAAAGVIGVGVDARGHGSRTVDGLDVSGAIPVLELLEIVDQTANDVSEVINSLGDIPAWDGQVAVWGFSMGAAIAVLAAVRDSRVRAAALIGLPVWSPDLDPAEYPRSQPDPVRLRHLAEQTTCRQILTGMGERPLLFAHGSLDDHYGEVCDLFAAMADTGSQAALLGYHGGHQPSEAVLDTVRDWIVGGLVRGAGAFQGR
ncbi:MAG: alpha/beta hydrolase [Acidimicrobiia bacterium]